MKIPLLFIQLLLLFVCAELNAQKRAKPNPPRMLKISDTIYFDQCEIDNLSYLEFVYWTGQVFGKNSEQYQKILPDRTVWTKHDSCLAPHTEYYLNHPAYRQYPVVGVTPPQAAAFAVWRSDRVFEFLLGREKIIKSNCNPDSTNYFSIERYYGGRLGIVPDTGRLYPSFRLPTAEEYLLARDFNEKTKVKPMKAHLAHNPCRKDSLASDATQPIFFPDKKIKRKIYCLQGNVRELLATGQMLGGSWADDTSVDALSVSDFTAPNAFTGFRNVCAYRKWVSPKKT